MWTSYQLLIVQEKFTWIIWVIHMKFKSISYEILMKFIYNIRHMFILIFYGAHFHLIWNYRTFVWSSNELLIHMKYKAHEFGLKCICISYELLCKICVIFIWDSCKLLLSLYELVMNFWWNWYEMLGTDPYIYHIKFIPISYELHINLMLNFASFPNIS